MELDSEEIRMLPEDFDSYYLEINGLPNGTVNGSKVQYIDSAALFSLSDDNVKIINPSERLCQVMQLVGQMREIKTI